MAKHVAAMDAAPRCPHEGRRPARAGRRHRRPRRLPAGDEDGRDFLRITEQLADWSGVGSGHPAEPLRGTVIGTQLEALTRRLGDRIGMPLARERVALMVTS